MKETSSTQQIPQTGEVPRHVAIIMDGNGRWAKGRMLPRIAGHRRGLEAVRATVQNCVDRGIEYLTLFAFSSENWRRPAEEVALLMQLFQTALTEERRRELVKVVKHEAENAKVAVRNLRRDAIHHLKESLKKHEVSENDERRAQDEVQKMTDRHVAEIDKLLQEKEKELMAV